jgi:hypothetical protein
LRERRVTMSRLSASADRSRRLKRWLAVVSWGAVWCGVV